MSDSDETVGPDSDETLPPDDDERPDSPDLFDDHPLKQLKAVGQSGMEPIPNKTSVKKYHNKIHEISDSESDTDTHSREPAGSKSKKGNEGFQRKGSNYPVIINREKDGFNQSKNIKTSQNFSAETGHDSETKSEKRKFINDFLNMTDSGSDDEYEENKRKLQTMKENTLKDKSKHSPGLNNGPKSCKNDHSTIARDSENGGKHHFSQKPHKKDYSKPFRNSEFSPHKAVETKSSLKTNDTQDKSDTHLVSSLKRKHSRSPVPHELRKAVTEILNENMNNSAKKRKIPCQYGHKCYRKNPSHFEEYSHPGDEDSVPATKRTKLDPTSSRARSKSPSVSKVKAGSSSSTSKVKSESPSASEGFSEMPSTSKVKTYSPTSDCKIVKRSGALSRIPKTIEEKLKIAEPYSFFLTKVAGIQDTYNTTFVMDIKDILSESMGNLTGSCQFNYMFDISWLMKQYPSQFSKNSNPNPFGASQKFQIREDFGLRRFNISSRVYRSKPLLIVHGEHGASMAALQGQAAAYTNIRFCQAKLEMMYGTHHTKMMFLLYQEGLRVVIHTSNLILQDWYQKTQGMWISPLFPRLPEASKDKGDSPTHFKRDLIEYLQAYKAYQLKEWIDHIAQHDMSSAKVVVIGSVPGRHVGDKTKSLWGHLKVRKILQEHGPSQGTVKAWPVVGQFSSIGSMGPNKENWLCGEWQQSLSAARSASGPQSNTRLQLIFPSRHNVRLSLEGYPAGGSIPYSASTAKKQPFLHDFFHVWKSEGRGRSRAMPHIKTYSRPMQDGSKAAWFIVTSANLSKAAWGALEKKGAQLMIRSYEIGVMFLPKFFGEGEIFPITSDPEAAATTNRFLLPYDLPPTIYDKKDRPWMWDIPYMDLPDTNGNVWCPFSK